MFRLFLLALIPVSFLLTGCLNPYVEPWHNLVVHQDVNYHGGGYTTPRHHEEEDYYSDPFRSGRSLEQNVWRELFD